MAASESRQPSGVSFGDLAPRVVVGISLIVLALAADWAGGWAFDVLVAAATLLVFREWCDMHAIGGGTRAVGFAGIVAVALISHFALPFAALATLAIFVVLLSLIERIAAGGLVYVGLPAVALIWLRQQPNGAELVIWTLALVWATDICAYFAGRLIGGPKIAPRISPSKTWAGLAGGMTGAAATAALLAGVLELDMAPAIAAAAGASLAVVAQIGDFFESHLKRRAGVKDSGNLLPGHGGVMDRLDGAIPVAVVVAAAMGVSS